MKETAENKEVVEAVVSMGRCFIFAQVPEGKQKACINLTGKNGKQKTYNISGPMAFSRFLWSYKDSQILEPIQCRLISVIPIRDLYGPKEAKHVLVSAPKMADAEIHVDIFWNNQTHTTNISHKLNEAGLLLWELPTEICDLGKYKIKVRIPSKKLETSCEFRIADHTISLLAIEVEEHNFQGGQPEITKAQMMFYGKSYTGKVKVDRQCNYCDGQLVDSCEAEFINGNLAEPFRFNEGHSGPFTLHFTTTEGHTTSWYAEQSGTKERRHITISNNFGNIHEAQLTPVVGKEPTREIWFSIPNSRTSVMILKNAVGKEAQVLITKDCDYVHLVMTAPKINSTEPEIEIKEDIFSNVKAQTELSISVPSPYGTLTALAFCNSKVIESQGQVVKPLDQEIKMEVPETAISGQDVEVKLTKSLRNGSSKPSYACLVVSDAGLITKRPGEKLGQGLFDSIEEMMANLKNHRGTRRYLDEDEIDSILDRFESEDPIFSLMSLAEDNFDEESYSAIESIGLLSAPITHRSFSDSPFEFGDSSGLFDTPDFDDDEDSNVNHLLSPARPRRLRGTSVKSGFMGATRMSRKSLVAKTHKTLAKRATVLTEARLDFPEIVFCQLVKMNQNEKIVKIKLGDQLEKIWKFSLYAFSGIDWNSQEERVLATKENGAEISVPAVISQGSSGICARVYYNTSQEGTTLEIAGSAVDKHEAPKQISGSGKIEIELIHGGEIFTIMRDKYGEILDQTSKTIGIPGQQTLKTSTVEILSAGQTVTGGRIDLFPGLGYYLDKSVDSLCGYPHGCGEQTSSKLNGLGLVFNAISQGVICGNGHRSKVFENIKAGLGRMISQFWHSDKKLFSMWERGNAGTDITCQILYNLSPFYKMNPEENKENGVDKIQQIMKECIEELIKKQIKDNSLVRLDSRFATEKIETLEDAVFLYESNADKTKKDRAVAFIRKHIKIESGKVGCSAKTKRWGGHDEALLLAARVLYFEDKELYKAVFDQTSAKLIGGRLYSTADTRAWVELLSIISAKKGDSTLASRIIINGQTVEVTKPMTIVDAINQEIIVENGQVVAQIWGEKKVNYLDLTPNLDFEVRLDKTTVKVGEKITATLILHEETRCPLANVWMPPNCVWNHGGEIYHIYEPFKDSKTLKLELTAIRTGKSKLFALAHDMYTQEKIGIAPGVEITVI